MCYLKSELSKTKMTNSILVLRIFNPGILVFAIMNRGLTITNQREPKFCESIIMQTSKYKELVKISLINYNLSL